jgi:hypothetical protein
MNGGTSLQDYLISSYFYYPSNHSIFLVSHSALSGWPQVCSIITVHTYSLYIYIHVMLQLLNTLNPARDIHK